MALTLAYPGVAYPGTTYPGLSSITSTQPGEAVGGVSQTRLVAYQANGPRIGAMPEHLSFDATVVYNDVGSLTVTYARDAVNGSVVMRPLITGTELALEVWTGIAWVEPDGCRSIVTGRSFDTQEMRDGALAVVSLSAVGYSWMLSRVRSLNTAVLLGEGSDNEGKRPFLSAAPGLIVETFLAEHATAGGLAWARNFTTGRDSSNSDWSKVLTVYYDHLQSLDVALENLSNQGACDWTTRGRELRVYNPDTALAPDVSASVRLWLGVHVAEAPSSESIEDLVSSIGFDGGDGLRFVEDDPTAPTPWGGWFGGLSNGSITDDGTARALVQAELARTGRVRGQYTRDLIPAQPPGSGIPLVDYGPGSWVTAPGAVGMERMRVQQVIVRSDGEGTTFGLVLNDVNLDRDLRRAKRQVGIVGGASTSGGSNVRPAKVGADKRTPAAPLGLTASSMAYIDSLGRHRAQASATWAAVTTARTSDGGGALEVAYYELFSRPNVVGAPWTRLATSDDTNVDVSRLDPGVDMQLKVRARGRYATSPGVFSAVVTITTATDDTPPPIPSELVLSTRLGIITARWDGLTDIGAEMPPDFHRIEITMTTTAVAFPTNADVYGTLATKGGLPVTGQAYGDDRFFRSRAVDNAGNRSDWSPQVSIAAVALVDTDAIQFILDGANIEPGTIVASDSIVANSITTAEIGALAVKAGQVDANDLWADNAFLGFARAGVLAVGAVSPRMLSFGTEELCPNPMWMDAERRTQYPMTDAFAYSNLSGFLRKGQTRTVQIAGALLGGSAQRNTISPEMPASPGEKFYLEITALNTSSVNFDAGIHLVGRKVDGSLDYTSTTKLLVPQGSTSGAYETRGGTVTVPNGWERARIDLVAQPGSGGVWYVSEVSARRALASTTETGEGLEVTPRGIKAWDTDGDMTMDLGNGTPNLLVGRTFRTGLPGKGPSLVLTNNGGDNNNLPAITWTVDGTTSGLTAAIFLDDYQGRGQLTLRSAYSVSKGTYAAVRVDRGLEVWADLDEAGQFHGIKTGDSVQSQPRWNFGVTNDGDISMNIGRINKRTITFPDAGLEFSQDGRLWSFGLDMVDGSPYFRSEPAASRTVTSPGNVYINSAGRFSRSTSLRKYKHDILDAPTDLSPVKMLRPVNYRDVGEMERQEMAFTQLGLLADEVEATGLVGLAQYDMEGNLNGVGYERLAVALLPWLHHLEGRLDAITQQLGEASP